MEDADRELAGLFHIISRDDLEYYPPKDLESRPECCIYKVPKCLREVNEKAYTPQLVSIGPIHRHNINLYEMKRKKLRYLKTSCERTSMQMLKGFWSFIKENVKLINMCYDAFAFDSPSEMSTETACGCGTSELVILVFKEAVFIIELFLRYFETRDFSVKGDWVRIELCMNLILLENRLPFFVLECLFNLASVSADRPPFLHVTCDYCNFFDLFGYLSYETHGKNLEIKHFTDLVWRSVVRYRPTNTYSFEEVEKVYSETMLHEACVGFKALQETSSPLDVQFEKGELQIPTFKMWHRAEAFIRNLMALEQCHYRGKAYVWFQDKNMVFFTNLAFFLNSFQSLAEYLIPIKSRF